jgi:topoisomerase-4 subunit A
MIKEIEADAKQHGDERRTLIQERKARGGRGEDRRRAGDRHRQLEGLGARAEGSRGRCGCADLQAGDALYGAFPCRSVDTLYVFGSNGRVYNVAVAACPAAAATASRSPR